MTIASGSADTGTAAGSELDKLLKAQDLTMLDLDANRAGTVSQHQADQVSLHGRRLSLIFFVIIGGLILMSAAIAFYDYGKHHEPAVFSVPGIAIVFSIVLYVFFSRVLKLPSIDGKHVTAVKGPIEGLVRVPNDGGYNVRIQGVTYKGVAKGMTLDLKGRVVTAYVVPESKMVVAIEPE
jgi:hypothetical protein